MIHETYYQQYLNYRLNYQLLTQHPVKEPAERITEIEHELDIIKGRVPTPEGYTITPARAKALTRELRELRAAA